MATNLAVLRTAFLSELEKVARGLGGTMPKHAALLGRLAGEAAGHKADLAGLGMLAGLSADALQARARTRRGEDWQKKSILGGEVGHHVGDIAGLGVLALPSAAHLIRK